MGPVSNGKLWQMESHPAKSIVRTRNAAAILAAAQIRFAAASDDQVTVHHFAVLAGANLALIHRYF